MSRYPLKSAEDRRGNEMWQSCRAMVNEICEVKKLTEADVWTHYYDLIDHRTRSAKTLNASKLLDLHKRLSDEISLKVEPSASIGERQRDSTGATVASEMWADLQRRAHEVNPVLWDVLWDRHCSLKSLGKRDFRPLGEVLEALSLDLAYEEREKLARDNRIIFAKYRNLFVDPET